MTIIINILPVAMAEAVVIKGAIFIGGPIMKACIIESFGGRDRLKITDLPTPEPGEGEVLVRIQAAGVNPVDWKIREGRLNDLVPPRIPPDPGLGHGRGRESCGAQRPPIRTR
jgi:hypothetical protein